VATTSLDSPHLSLEDPYAPVAILKFDGEPLPDVIQNAVTRVEYEDTLDKASMVKIEIQVGSDQADLVDSPLFDPGRAVDVYFGLGARRQEFVGRCELVRHRPRFDELISFELTGYDRSYLMMQEGAHLDDPRYTYDRVQSGGGDPRNRVYSAMPLAAPLRGEVRVFNNRSVPAPRGTRVATAEIGNVSVVTVKMPKRGRRGRPASTKHDTGQVWDGTIGEIVSTIMGRYGVRPNIDPKLENIKLAPFAQRKGARDYTVLTQIANVYGAVFFVWFDPVQNSWIGTFMLPDSLREHQSRRYNFKYRDDRSGTIISAEFDYGIDDGSLEYQVWIFNRAKKDWDPILSSDAPTLSTRATTQAPMVFSSRSPSPTEVDPKSLEDRQRLKIEFGGYQIEVLPTRTLDKAAARAYALAWLRRYQEDFLICNLQMVCCPALRAGQVHTLSGFPARFNGLYYFSQVTHSYDGGGMQTSVVARRIIGAQDWQSPF